MTKKRIIVAGVVSLAVLLSAGLWFFGRPIYHQWKERRFLAQGRAFVQKSQYANAWICGLQALNLNPKNVETCRLLAELAEKGRSPQAIYFRRKIAELQPTVENRLAWARTALNIESFPFPLTAKALASVDEAGRRTASYHSVAAALALKRNSFSEAEFHFNEAARLEPQSELIRMNLAALQLRSRDPKIVDEAQHTLENLRTNSACRLPALRSLVNFCLENKKLDQAQMLSKELHAEPGAEFSDRILRLAVLHVSKSAEFADYLHAVQKEAVKSAKNVYNLTAWMTINGLSDQALQWVQTIPENIRKEHPVPLAVAEIYAAKAKWYDLDGMLREQNWGAHDFLRLAFLARALRAEGEAQAADVNWQKSVRLASERPEMLAMIGQMAEAWGWKSEAEEALRLVVNKFPDQRWALQSLYQVYLSRGDTRRMREVYAAVLKQDPADAAAKNNLATVSFLLNLDLDQAHKLAQEIYNRDPKNPSFVSTYAYSLHLRGKTKEGLKVLQTLNEQDLRAPSIALYYGLLLTAAGDSAAAKQFLALAEKAQLLPEERTLLSNARQGG